MFPESQLILQKKGRKNVYLQIDIKGIVFKGKLRFRRVHSKFFEVP